MTQTIVQGSEDPLLVLDHQGGSGNPSFEIQQDETAMAFIFWDQVNQAFNMGPASVGGPSLSIASDGTVSMGDATINGLKVGDLLVSGGGIIVNQNMRAANATINELTAGDLLVNGGGIVVNQNMNAASATISELTAGDLLVNGSGIVVNQNMNAASAAISELTAGDLLVNGGEIVVNNLSVGGTVSASDFLLSSSAEIKDNIIDLSNPEALEVLEHLSQVKFNYKADEAKKAQIGFIAEDVPRSVASSDGQGISLTNIVSVLARVVKEQQKTINALSEKFHSLELAMNRALS